MKKSKYIKTITINDPRNPGNKITLAIHEVDGGFMGIDTNYTDEVANYIINPFQECEFVKIDDTMDDDDQIDPPLDEDALLGFIRLLVAFDETLDDSKISRQEKIEQILAKTNMTSDQVSMLLGLAKSVLVDLGEKSC